VWSWDTLEIIPGIRRSPGVRFKLVRAISAIFYLPPFYADRQAGKAPTFLGDRVVSQMTGRGWEPASQNHRTLPQEEKKKEKKGLANRHSARAFFCLKRVNFACRFRKQHYSIA